MVDILFAIFAFLILIGLVVTIHEGGHFVTALLCRIKVLEFSIGFGPKILQRKFGKDGILFTLRALPMGGFVKPLDKGMISEDEWNKLPPEEQSRALSVVPRWKRALMVLGGPLSNFVLAIVLFFGIFYTYGSTGIIPVVSEIVPGSMFDKSGINPGDKIKAINNIPVQLSHETYTFLIDSVMGNDNIKITVENKTGIHNIFIDTHSADYKKLLTSQNLFHGLYLEGQKGDIYINRIRENSPAEQAGLQSGDMLVSLNNIPMNDLSKSIRYIQNFPEDKLPVTILRNGEKKDFNVNIQRENVDGRTIGIIGIYSNVKNPTNVTTLQYSLIDALSEGISSTIIHTSTSINTIKKLVLGQISTKAISGPLSIAEYSGSSLQMGLKYFIQMMALISIAIGVFNLLPIPMLDGGHLLQYFIESIRGKNYNSKELLMSNYVGIICLFGIFTLAMGNDLIRYVQMIP